jgi:hypothetical protein
MNRREAREEMKKTGLQAPRVKFGFATDQVVAQGVDMRGPF